MKEGFQAEDRRICTLPEACRLIAEQLRPIPPEDVDLHEALGRITAAAIAATEPVPAFAESARDGYVLGEAGEGGGQFLVVDEIAAGRVQPAARLSRGTACRIMTGGQVPEGSSRVVPYEQCVEQDGRLKVPDQLLQKPATFIRRAGSEIAAGQRLVGAGVRLLGEHLELLAGCGVHTVAVGARPAAGYFCTGSELMAGPAGLQNGQKVSSNSLLLAGILPTYGATLENFGIAGDTSGELAAVFAGVGRWAGDLVVSTGGMGPGKYDLVEQAFVAAGGDIFFNGLEMRPGKAMLFGRLGRTLFFALPGPPHAVRTLLHTLVGPALLAMQGMKSAGPPRTLGHLLHLLEVGHHDILQLKDGVLVLSGGRCTVRLAGRLEVANCHLLLPPGRGRYGEGELVEVHLVGEPLVSA